MNRKKYQRRMNKLVRNINKSIENDWLWNGRFYIRQKDAWFEIYSDHSGANLHVLLEMHDRKTGRIAEKQFDNYSAWNLYWWVDDCITTQFKVWEENPNPNQQARIEGRYPN